MKKNRFSFRASLLIAVLILLQTGFAWGQADDFPVFERFLKNGDIAGYAHAAQDYIRAHPDSEFTPRVALDLLMLAQLNDKTAIVEDMSAKLLLDYLETVQGTYFGSTYSTVEDYRSRLTKLLDQHIQTPTAGFPKKYRRALMFGSKKFGNDVFSDNDFLLKSAFVVAASGDSELQRTLLDSFMNRGKKDDKLHAIAALATDETKSLPERVVGLHSESEEPTAGFLRDLLILSLSKSEKDSPALRQVIAESLLEQRKFQAALAILEQLPTDKNGDKILFQRLWCYAVTGDMKQVAALQARLDKEFPNSSWHEHGLQLSRSAEIAGKNLGLYVDALRTVVATAKNDFAELEASLSFENKKLGKTYTAYLAFANTLNLFEFQLRTGDDLAVAYKSTATDSMFFTKDEPAIRRFLQSGFLFSPVINVARTQDNLFNINGSFAFQQFGKSQRNSSLDSPYLNDPESIKAMIQNSLYTGVLLGEVSQSPAGRTFSFFRPKVQKPEINEWRIVVSNDNRIVSVQSANLNLHDVRYGSANSIKFAPPAWPTLKVVTEEKFNASILFKIVAKVMEVFVSQQ